MATPLPVEARTVELPRRQDLLGKVGMSGDSLLGPGVCWGHHLPLLPHYGLNCASSPNSYVEVLVPQDVTLFGNGVFAEALRLRQGH